MRTLLVEKSGTGGAFDRIGVPVAATTAAEDRRTGGRAHVQGGALVVGQQLLVAPSHLLFAQGGPVAHLVLLFTYLVLDEHLLEQQVVEVLAVFVLAVHVLAGVEHVSLVSALDPTHAPWHEALLHVYPRELLVHRRHTSHVLADRVSRRRFLALHMLLLAHPAFVRYSVI